MKTRAGILTSVSLCAVVLPGSALYAQQSNGQGKLYLEFEAGVALQQNVDVEVPQTVELEFDPGVRFDIGAGYRFSDSLAVEVQVGYVFNSIDLIGGVDPSDVGVDLDLQQIPITANLIYTFPLESRFKPFVGGGAGGSVGVAVAEADGDSESQDAFAFAFQGVAGFRYQLTDRAELGFVYKFLGTTGYEFDDFETDNTFNHMLGLTFVYTF